MKEETTNEKLILQAAEEEFISKGYNGAKTTAIARRAGVTHAMLHYYYRTKENLFQKVFQEKIQMIADSFGKAFDENLPFEDTIRSFVEKHYDFVMENKNLINFVYNEIRANKENMLILRSIISPKTNYIFQRFDTLIKQEVDKGNIRPTNSLELFMSTLTLNLGASIFFLINEVLAVAPEIEGSENLIKQKKEQNVQFILQSLRIK
ncbi:TetR/AcrR family transcriptional regulator [Bacteroidales bacterium OttesenSCG-928-J19]|nr:TetR/AcrR family transcriptional regulator [Bacteroidales bacterium OttesenSCG-928-J19]